MSLVVVVAGGEPPDESQGRQALQELLSEPADHVIGADSGLDHARVLGLSPTVLVGDLDSISAEGLHWAHQHDVVIEEHPTDKNETDLELALAAACRLGDEVIVVDGRLGRFDHAVGNLFLLGSDRWADVAITAVLGGSRLTVVRGHRELRGRPGDVVSLFPVGGPARGVTTEGLRWPLDRAELLPGSSLGTSNVFDESQATVEVAQGVVYAIQPSPERS